MLIYDFHVMGNNLFEIRKRLGLTQSEVAEKAGLSDRTYADIERGNVNMRVETLFRICDAMKITPDEILTKEKEEIDLKQETLILRLSECTAKEKSTALKLLSDYLGSVE